MEITLKAIKKIIPQWALEKVRPAYHFLLAFFAALFYGFPSRHLTVIGVTGTKGKTTVVELLHEIFGGRDAPAAPRVASVSSLRFRIGDKETRNLKKMTMPGRFFLQKFLHQARRAGIKYVILEVTSEGIKQYRHRFINFSAAVMTNLAPEHIEAHGSSEKYLRAKLDLFWRLPQDARAVINRDDSYADRFSAATAARKIWYGKEGVVVGEKRYPLRSDFKIFGGRGTEGAPAAHPHIEFDLNGQTISSPLPGEFNFYNILAAAATALSFHISLEKIASAVARVKVIPGRMEFIQNEPFAVVVDYAHTPDSLRKVYTFLKASRIKHQESRLICVLGAAGGGRDKWKRPELGKIAAEFCDKIILTNEDPYDENPQEILEQISSGFPQSQRSKVKYQMLLDRCEAIHEAIKSAKPGDAVIITGKGAEPWMMLNDGKKIQWDDREVAEEALGQTTQN